MQPGGPETPYPARSDGWRAKQEGKLHQSLQLEVAPLLGSPCGWPECSLLFPGNDDRCNVFPKLPGRGCSTQMVIVLGQY